MTGRECFFVELMTGETLRFDRKCNHVKYDHPEVCVFQHMFVDGVRRYETLAIIPYTRIVKIYKEGVII